MEDMEGVSSADIEETEEEEEGVVSVKVEV